MTNPVDENGLLTTEANTLDYTVKDTAGNEASASVLVKYCHQESCGSDNYCRTDPEIVYSVSGAGSGQFQVKSIKMAYWNISDSAWVGPTLPLFIHSKTTF